MSKQVPMLMESLITKRVYIVTSYVDNGNGMFTARQKYDVTEQFESIAKHRERSAELESLINDMWHEMATCPDYPIPPCMTRNVCDRIRELGIGVSA